MGRCYGFVPARPARAFADSRYSRAVVERRARLETGGLGLEDGPAGLVLHCFAMAGREGP